MSLSVPLAAQVREHCDHHAHHDVHHDTGSVHESSMLSMSQAAASSSVCCTAQQLIVGCVRRLDEAVSGMLRCAAEGAGFE